MIRRGNSAHLRILVDILKDRQEPLAYVCGEVTPLYLVSLTLHFRRPSRLSELFTPPFREAITSQFSTPLLPFSPPLPAAI